MLQEPWGFDSAQHEVRTKIVASMTTFLTIACIIAVNPGIFSVLEPIGMPTSAVRTTSALAAISSTLALPFYTKKPFGPAQGMGEAHTPQPFTATQTTLNTTV